MMPKIKPITPTQEILAAAFIEGHPIDESVAAAAGLASAASAQRALKTTSMRAHLATYLDNAGATLEKSARVVSEAMDATESKFFAFEGEVCDERTVVDHGTRLRAAELNLEARGELKQGLTINFNKFDEMSDVDLAKIALGEAPPALPGGLVE